MAKLTATAHRLLSMQVTSTMHATSCTSEPMVCVGRVRTKLQARLAVVRTEIVFILPNFMDYSTLPSAEEDREVLFCTL
jgi:hypothetical protein